MPRLHEVRERFDQLLSKNFFIEPGQEKIIEECPKDGYILAGMALRLLDVKPENEMLHLDHLGVSLEMNNRTYGPWCGTVLSTFRQVYEPMVVTKEESLSKAQIETGLRPFRAAGRRAKSKELERMAWSTMPGYVFLRSFVIPVFLNIKFKITAAPTLKLLSAPVRLILFGMQTRDVTAAFRRMDEPCDRTVEEEAADNTDCGEANI